MVQFVGNACFYHKRSNLMARKRGLQENNFLKVKRQGDTYSHVLSHHWAEGLATIAPASALE